MIKRCAKRGSATFFGSMASKTSRCNQILGKSRHDSRVQTPLRDFFRAPTHENVAQKEEAQRFSVQWRPKRRATTRNWEKSDAMLGSKRLCATFLGLRHTETLRKRWNRNVFRFNGVQNVVQLPDIREIKAQFTGPVAFARHF
jgi:hypothetical protein